MQNDVSRTESISLSVDSPERVAADDEWDVEVTLVNGSDRKIPLLQRVDGRTDVVIEVHNPEGGRIERTAFGKRRLPGTYIEGAFTDRYSATHTLLEPGGSHTWTVNLSRCFEWKPGEYTVSMYVRVPHWGKITKELTVSVADSPTGSR
jgi:hypothetical protein